MHVAFFYGESRNEIATMQEVRNTRGGKKVGCITVYMCVGVVVLHGLVQTFLKEASTWSATKQQNAHCVQPVSEAGNRYKVYA